MDAGLSDADRVGNVLVAEAVVAVRLDEAFGRVEDALRSLRHCWRIYHVSAERHQCRLAVAEFLGRRNGHRQVSFEPGRTFTTSWRNSGFSIAGSSVFRTASMTAL